MRIVWYKLNFKIFLQAEMIFFKLPRFPIFENMETVHLLISGKVQGVFFRETSRKLAEQLNIKGWIKNTADDKVEVLITGEESDVNDFVNWCKKGPERAEVEHVRISKQEEMYFEKFEVIRRK